MFFIIALFQPVITFADITPSLRDKIVSQGVPGTALDMALAERARLLGTTLSVPTYHCKKSNGRIDPTEKPCVEEDRIYGQQTVLEITDHPYLAIVDFSQISTRPRFFLIHLTSGAVLRSHVSHGIGTGEVEAVSFSNIKDSRKSSLGLHVASTVYNGKYGPSLRLHGLNRSNDQTYNRDIVLHSAYYSRAKFMREKNPKTGGKFNRLGVSWGCPAIPPEVAKKVISSLQNGGLIYHYHPLFMEQIQSTGEFEVPPPFLATE